MPRHTNARNSVSGADPHLDALASPHHPPLPRRGPVLLAVSGDSRSRASAIVAAKVADRLGVPLFVVTVIEPIPIYTGPVGIEPMPLLFDEQRWEAHKRAVQDHLTNAIGAHALEFYVRSGSIAQEVCAAAREIGATLIVVSSAPHRRGDNVVSGVRAAQILRRSPCAVLSVVPHANDLPRRIISGIDFGPPSLYAAELGLSLAHDTVQMTLVNVPMPFEIPRVQQEWSGALIGGDIDELFTRTRELLEPYRPAHATVDTKQETGIITDALLMHADMASADLITVGTHGPGVVERFVVGSIATNTLHLASTSVLAAPAPPVAEATRFRLGLLDTIVSDQPSEWEDILKAFSQRNSGRRATLEVDDASVGAQLQANNYVFAGVVYDHHDHRVECMMHTRGTNALHMTRMIERVQSIAIYAKHEHDYVLEIRHGEGHTMLLLDPRTDSVPTQ